MNLKEIAKQCNVSLSTVSLVLNNKEGVSSEKRSYITRILEENGYEIQRPKKEFPVKSIRFLKYSKHSHLVNGNPGFVTAIIDSIERECRRQNFNLVITSFKEKDLNEISEMIRNDPLDGAIFLGTEFDTKHLHYFEHLTVPLIFVDNRMEMEKYDSVTMDNSSSIYKAVEYLLSQGHRQIGYLANALPGSNCLERRDAFCRSIRILHLYSGTDYIYQIPPTTPAAYEHVCQLLRNKTVFPTALIATNDSIALGAMKAFREFGFRVPEDISIIGFDDIEAAPISEPPLTTLRVNCKDMGIWTVRLLCARMQAPSSSIAKIQVGTELIIRESTITKKS